MAATGREIILKTLEHQKVDRVPWVPFTGVHSGKLKGYTGEEILKSEDKLFESLMEVHRVYNPDGMPIMFDLQVEAEILGCELLWAEKNPPTVMTHPLESTNELPCACKMPTETSGRLPMILSTMRRMKKEVGDTTALYGLICGPFTLANHLRGTNIFMDMMMDVDYVKSLMDYCAKVDIEMCRMYIEAGMDVIAVVDPLVSQVSPDMIDDQLSDGFRAVFDYIRSKGVKSSFFVCGNASHQIEAMCKTNPDGISVDENVDLVKAKEITDKYNITIGGNIPLTTSMLLGNQQDNMKSVIDLLDSIKDHHNFIVSPGCDMPYDVPVENCVACEQAVHNTDNIRKVIENYTSTDFDLDVELPDYEHLDKVLIELFLLDPDQCAACGYMKAAVLDNFDAVKDFCEYRIYKYTVREDIARFRKMGVANLPTLVINGKQKWISIIPNKDQLLKDLNEAKAEIKK